MQQTATSKPVRIPGPDHPITVTHHPKRVVVSAAGRTIVDTRNALILRVGQDGVVAAERHATVLGITGVPTYIFDGQYTISGAQEVGIFARVFDQVAEFASARGVAS